MTTQARAQFKSRLTALLWRVRLHVLAYGLLQAAVGGGAAVLAAAWVGGGSAPLEGFLGLGLTVTLAVLLATLLGRLVLVPLGRLRSPADLAARLERQGDFANLLIAAEEAQRRPERWDESDPVVRLLTGRLLERALDVLQLLTPAAVWPLPRRRTLLAGLALVAGLGAWFALSAPDELRSGLQRLSEPGATAPPPPRGVLVAQAEGALVVAGTSLDLAAVDFAGGSGTAVCEIRAGGGLWQTVPARLEWVYPERGGLPAVGRRWVATLPAVREDFSWRFRREAMSTDERQVTVRRHPLLTGLGARIEPPRYTRLAGQDLERLPAWVEVPQGATLRLAGRTSHPAAAALLVTAAGDTAALHVSGETVSGSLTVARSTAFRILLADSFGLRNQEPLLYEIAAVPDAPPSVDLERPDDDGALPLSGEFELSVIAGDDYGLAGLELEARLLADRADPERWRRGPIWSGSSTPPDPEAWRDLDLGVGRLRLRVRSLEAADPALRVRLGLTVSWQDLPLLAGDGLELAVTAIDNLEPPPAGRGRSAVLRLVVPSAGDVLAEQVQTDQQRRDALQEMSRRRDELAADLDRLNRELLKNPLPDWARQQEMESALRRHRALQEELARVAEELRRDLDRLGENQLTSEALQDKAEQIAQLLDQSADSELADLLQGMENSGEAGAPREAAQAMREVARQQQDLARRLDAALAMLQRMAQEQQLEGLTSLLEKMMTRQQELADTGRELAERRQEAAAAEDSARETPAAQAARDEAIADLAERQEALAEEMAELQEQLLAALEELRQEMAEGQDDSRQQELMESLEQAMQQLQDKQQQESMDQAAQDLQQMDPQAAAEQQQQAMRDLGSLYHVLIQSQQALQMALQMEQVSSLRGLAADLLAVSTRQEEISARIPLQLREVRSLELTRGQHRLQQAVIGVRARLSLLLEEAPQRIMKLLEKLDDLIEVMGAGVRALEENRGPVARQQAAGGLAAANEIVIGLLTEAQMRSSSPGAGGGGSQSTPSLAEQLKQLAQEQAGLNGGLEQLREMLANRGMSQALRAQMQRLGQQQAELAGRMGDLAEQERQAPQGERLLGDLAQLGQDMEQVAGEVDQGLVSNETLVRQQRILSRMLDARNSVRQRDYLNRRESRTASELFGPGDGLGGAPGEDPERRPLRLRFQPLEQAPLEYRDLVRRYFAALDSLDRLPAAPAPAAPPEELP